ncbi:DUF3732 domain-containing protein [Bacillus sp. S3]|uniref:DUF3732 domain-containing protein n=1 Tax=Bacillus sp. S3 TaxID=486398 RepID=UPI00118CD224|nr:DUF3732 domain-containing protein [Bacillus sp. S3]QCJ40834.1 DUF3732 domain-containing protein [Bacillus sp. S3]
MKFYISKLVLWLKNGKVRELDFETNKVNVITGESGTGKSEIISIIDYCFFASKVDITEEKINENVNWYGIRFKINDKVYTIARGRINQRKLSSKYYFSSLGVIPETPVDNMQEKDIKSIIEKEFSITDKTVFPFGGKKILLGSKISPRYFFMFNTQSGDVITHSEVYFDKQNDDKYREALTRIFDLAVGIETEENLSIKEKIVNLNKEINALQRKQSVIDKEINAFNQEIRLLVQKAQSYNLIEYKSFEFNEALTRFKELTNNYKEENIDINIDKINELKVNKNSLIRKVRNLRRFKKEYEEYRKLEAVNLDSLKPVIAIKEAYYRLIGSPEVDLFINALNEEYYEIKKNIEGKPPFDFNIDDRIKEYEKDIEKINTLINDIPLNEVKTRNEIDKLMFIGELKAKISLYESQWEDTNDKDQIKSELEEKLSLKDKLEKEVVDYTERKDATLRLLDEIIQNYLDKSADAIPTYKGYKSSFQYKEKSLKLKAPKALIPSKVGSSSNHLFLHLCLFLGLQELVIRQQSPYVPYWLIIDQPSRPYFGEENKKEQKEWNDVLSTDRSKIRIAMQLLNNFITYINNELGMDFQIIVLEHIPKSIWEEANLENFYLVDDEFRNGNALIRFDKGGNPY